MKPLSVLRKELSALRQAASDAEWRDPRIKEARAALSQTRRTVEAEYRAKIAPLEAEIAARAKGPRPKPELPPEARDVLKRMTHGLVDGDKMTLEPLHGPFYIFHTPGGTWSDNGGQHYGQATHKVIDIRKDDKSRGIRTQFGVSAGLVEVSGRLSKAQRLEWLEWAKAQIALDKPDKGV